MYQLCVVWFLKKNCVPHKPGIMAPQKIHAKFSKNQ
jgi:hypothetical protein